MKNVKNFLIYICVFAIILVSFLIPQKLIDLENNKLLTKIFERQKDEPKIDVEAEKIYLVKAIHDIEDENSIVEIKYSPYNQTLYAVDNRLKIDINSVNEEIDKLNKYNILKEGLDTNEKLIYFVNKFCKNNAYEYTVNSLHHLGDEFWEMDREEKTGKIISITIPSQKLSDRSESEIMRSYVEYLDLYIIDDWKLDGEFLVSEKANLAVGIEKEGDIITLHIFGINRLLYR